MPHSHWRARGRIDKIIISMLSAIQQSPTMMLSTTWNLPNPMLLTAWVTVKVSSGTTPLTAAVNSISAPIMLRLFTASTPASDPMKLSCLRTLVMVTPVSVMLVWVAVISSILSSPWHCSTSNVRYQQVALHWLWWLAPNIFSLHCWSQVWLMRDQWTAVHRSLPDTLTVTCWGAQYPGMWSNVMIETSLLCIKY